MTRSHKLNDREYPADGMLGTRENLPRYFAKSGPTDADPRKTKKDGGGKGNWSVSSVQREIYLSNILSRGRSGDEMQDCDYKFTNTRRRSNSSTQGLADFSTKFEAIDPEPVFEEGFHGVSDMLTENESTVTKVDSTSSNTDSEIDHSRVNY